MGGRIIFPSSRQEALARVAFNYWPLLMDNNFKSGILSLLDLGMFGFNTIVLKVAIENGGKRLQLLTVQAINL